MNQKKLSMWKRYPFCGGKEIFGTTCTIEEETQVVSCTCSKATIKGYDWTIIFYLMKKVNNGKIHLVDRAFKDKTRSQEQVWQDLSIEFNLEMKFTADEDVKNGKQLRDFLTTIQGTVLLYT
jgi:hypothetical protein